MFLMNMHMRVYIYIHIYIYACVNTCMYACICSVQQANDTCKPSQWNSANLFCATFATASFGSSVAFCQRSCKRAPGSIPMLLDVATQPECDP